MSASEYSSHKFQTFPTIDDNHLSINSSSQTSRMYTSLLKISQKRPTKKKVCGWCGKTSTTQWRVGPTTGSEVMETLCNACGINYRRVLNKYPYQNINLDMLKRQQREEGRTSPLSIQKEIKRHRKQALLHQQPYLTTKQTNVRRHRCSKMDLACLVRQENPIIPESTKSMESIPNAIINSESWSPENRFSRVMENETVASMSSSSHHALTTTNEVKGDFTSEEYQSFNSLDKFSHPRKPILPPLGSLIEKLEREDY